jgi:hypothetical protein
MRWHPIVNRDSVVLMRWHPIVNRDSVVPVLVANEVAPDC